VRLNLHPLEDRTVPTADLFVTTAQAPATVSTSAPVTLTWTVQNGGTTAAQAESWYDSIFSSSDQTLDATDVLLGSFPHTNSPGLGGGASYQQAGVLFFPATPAGNRYLLVVADGRAHPADEGNRVAESDEGNNVKAVPITLIPPLVDLALTAASGPSTAAPGAQVSLSWTVTNQGTEPAAATRYDSVYLSGDTTLDPQDTPLSFRLRPSAEPLAPGASETVTHDLTIPASISPGRRYLLIKADGFDYQTESDETNNVRAIPFELPGAAPDLTVTDLAAPAAAKQGATITASWKVTNLGDAASPFAVSTLYLSRDNVLDRGPGGDVALTGLNVAPLAPGASTSLSATFATIPPGTAPGDYYLFAVVEAPVPLSDRDDSNNVASRPITVQQVNADLVVTALAAPPAAKLSTPVAISWTVANQGAEAAESFGWADAVFISSDQVLDASDTFVSAQYRFDGSLPAGGSYHASATFLLPDTGAGDRYLLLVADGRGLNSFELGNRQPETDEGNNVRAVPIALSRPDVDLVVSAAQAPAAASIGSPVAFSWTVANTGTEAAQGRWLDSVYVSSDQTLDGTDLLLGTRERIGAPLAPGASYEAAGTYTLPATATGDRYLLFVTDSVPPSYVGLSGYGQAEAGEGNNLRVVPVRVEPPTADLTVSAASAAASASPGEVVTVSLTVTNVGTGTAGVVPRYDAVYLSDDAVFDPFDQFVGSSSYNPSAAPLAAGASENLSASATIPATAVPGARFLLVVADAMAAQPEVDEGNNVRAVPITLAGAAADLRVGGVTAPASASPGQSVTVSWTVTNAGDGQASADWSDYVYLSADDQLDANDLLIASHAAGASTPLAPGASYAATVTATLPANLSAGTYRVLVRTDGSLFQPERDESNNVAGTTIRLALPDLRVTEASGPATGSPGSGISLNWTVRNDGGIRTDTDWYDVIYLSTDPILDSSDVLVAFFSAADMNPLDAGFSYQASGTVLLPSEVSAGAYYLLVVADGLGYQRESEENNNAYILPITLALPDLRVTEASGPAAVSPGATVALSWTVLNGGEVAAGTYWYDAVYISTDPTLGADDQLLTTVFHDGATPLAAGANYQVSQSVLLPSGLAAGSYYLLVVTDGLSTSYLGESDETNNAFALAVTVSAADLLVTEASGPASGVLGDSVQVSWTVRNQGDAPATGLWYDHAYLSDDEVLDSGDTYLGASARPGTGELPSGGTYSATQSFRLRGPGAGGRYLLIQTNGDRRLAEGDTSNNFRTIPISLTGPDLAVTGASGPAEAALGQTVDVTWTVENVGSAPAANFWYDRVYLSRDRVLDSGDVVVNYYSIGQSPLAVGADYTGTASVYLPQFSAGPAYLLFVADGFHYLEEASEENNAFSLPITLRSADFVVTEATAPPVVTLGEPFDLDWAVSNQGDGSAEDYWYDGVYLSSDQMLDSSDTYVGDASPPSDATPLAPGAGYANRATFTPPSSATGARYLLIVANRYGHPEVNQANNTRAIPVIVRGADLVVSAASGPPVADLGETVSLSWTVQNVGDAAAAAEWVDYVYASDDEILDYSDTLVGSYAAGGEYGPLAAGGEYTASAAFTIPATRPGARYLLFATDTYYNAAYYGEIQAEGNNGNNVRAVPIRLRGPDLEVTDVVAPVEAFTGDEVLISWSLANRGDGPATGSWTDFLYLSADGVIGSDPAPAFSDRYLGEFTFTGTIPAGGSITRRQSITLPLDLVGGYRVVVRTNAYQEIGEGSYSNNAAIDADSINVLASVTPNLVVSEVRPPTAPFSGQQTTVQWVVTNTGSGATSAPYWHDRVWLSTDAILDDGDVYLGDAENPSYLDAGDGYLNQLLVTLPQGISGTFYFLVQTDFSNSVFERGNEGDNLTAGEPTAVQLTPPPDLQVVAVNAPSQTFSGRPLNLTWTVRNAGPGRVTEASGYWYDEVFLSSDATLDAGDLSLGRITPRSTFSFALDPNREYTAGVGWSFVDPTYSPFMIPAHLSGEYYVFVVTDVTNRVFEHINEGNNSGLDLVPVRILLTPPPDLEVLPFATPATALAGETLTVRYTVANLGASGTPQYYWYDSLYLSSDNQLDGADQALATSYHYGQLAPNGSYEVTATVRLPEGLAGSYYLIAAADRGDQVFEVDNDNNARASSPLTLEIRQADLVPGAVTAPESSRAGQAVRVQWTVTNQGIGATQVTYYDTVVLSRDAVRGNSDDQVLVTSYRGTPLEPGAGYTRSELVTLPLNLEAGTYRLFVVTDAGSQIAEGSGEGNNASAPAPITVVQETADLQVVTVSGSATVNSGQNLSVTWKVRNGGLVATNSDYWYDSIYLSKNATLDSGDTLLGTAYRGGRLEVGAEYTGTREFAVPIDLSGEYFVIAVTDASNHVFEGAAEGNNRAASATTTGVALSPVADLTVTAVDAPLDALSGQPMTVAWTVRNAGGGATPAVNWTDTIYLSRDQFFDRSSDIYIGYQDRPGRQPDGTWTPLAAGGEYTATGLFQIPRGLSGPFYVFVVTDQSDRVYERGAELNNTGYDQRSGLVRLAPPADLVVGTVNVPANRYPGQQASIAYTIRNQGTDPALGSWYDSIYLSADATWDLEDPLFARVLHTGDVPSGASYSRTVTGTLPGVLPGEYHVIIRTDIRNQVRESNERNNVTGSLDRFDIDAERLQLGAVRRVGLSDPMYMTQRGGELFVSNTHRNEILRYDTLLGAFAGVFVPSGSGGLSAPGDLAFDDRGRLYVINATTGDVQRFSENGGPLGVFVAAGSGGLSDPAGLTFGPDGDLYVSSRGTDQILRYDGETGAFLGAFVGAGAGGLHSPGRLIFSGDLYVVGTAPGKVFRFAGPGGAGQHAPGQLVASWEAPSAQPFDLEWINFQLYVTDGGGTYRADSRMLDGLDGVPFHWTHVSSAFAAAIEPSPSGSFGSVFLSNTVTENVYRYTFQGARDESFELQPDPATVHYFRVDVPAGETLRVSLPAPSLGVDWHEIYVSHGAVPARGASDYRSDPFLRTPEVVVPTTEAGTYYILVVSESPLSEEGYGFSLKAEIIPFSITSTDSRTVDNAGRATVRVRGAKFSSETAFELVAAGGEVLPATSKLVADASTAYVTFDTSFLAPGQYTVRAVQPSGAAAAWGEKLTVVAGEGAVVTTDLDAPLQVRPNRTHTFNLLYGNTGGGDTGAPLLLIETEKGTPVGLSQAGMVGAFATQALGASLNGPADVLRPGAQFSLTVYFHTPTNQNDLGFRLRAIETTDRTPITEDEWVEIANSVRPTGVADADWQAFWGRVQPRIGTTWGDYVSTLNRMMVALSPAGSPIRDVKQLFGKMLADNSAYLPSVTASGRLLDAKTGAPLANTQVGLYRMLSDRPELAGTALTDSEGRFTIPQLQAGEHFLALTALDFDSDRNGVADDSPPRLTISPNADASLGDVFVYTPQAAPPPAEAGAVVATDASGRTHMVWSREGMVWHAYWNGTDWINGIPVSSAPGSNITIRTARNLIDGTEDGVFLSWVQGGGNDAEVYYAVGRPRLGGGYEWSLPVNLTHDAVADAGLDAVVLSDGRVLVTVNKANKAIQDDTDGYYYLVQVNAADYVWPTEVAEELLAPAGQADSQFGNAATTGWKVEFGKSWDLQTLSKGALFGVDSLAGKVKGEIKGSAELKGCEIVVGASIGLTIEGKNNAVGLTFSGTGSASGKWTVNKSTRSWTPQSSRLGFAGQASIDIKNALTDMLRWFGPQGIAAAAGYDYAVALAAKLTGGKLQIENGVNITLGVDLGVEWDEKEPFPDWLLPDRGTIKFSARGGPYVKAQWGDGEFFNISANGYLEGAVQTSFPGQQSDGPSGEFGFEVKVQLGLFTFSGSWSDTIGGSSLESVGLNFGALDTPLAFQYNPAGAIGSTNVYGANAVLATAATDVVDDGAISLAKGADGVFGAWAKAVDPDSRRMGNVIYVADFTGSGWATPVAIPGTLGINRGVTATTDSSGRRMVVWSHSDSSAITPATTLEELLAVQDASDLYYSVFEGGAWSAPRALAATAGSDGRAKIVNSADGRLLAAWQSGTSAGDSLLTASWDGAGWSLNTAPLTTGKIGDVTVGQLDGRNVIFWSQISDAETSEGDSRIYYSTLQAGEWSDPTLFTPAVASTGLEATGAEFSAQALSLPAVPEECLKCKTIKTRTIEGPCRVGGGSDSRFDKNNCEQLTIIYKPCVVRPSDPNDIVGPVGFGDEHWVPAEPPLAYTIRFENRALASAPAQQVVITQQLDADLDWRTFRLDDFGWGDQRVELDADQAYLSRQINLTDTRGYVVDVAATVNVKTGQVIWVISTLDPATGEAPLNPQLGFLPTNDDSGRGEGFVSYTIRPKATATTGTRIDAEARIVFDTEEPIDTPAIFNTLDAGVPESRVESLPASTEDATFTVKWAGADDEGGSGVATYTVYASTNGGDFEVWLDRTTLTEAPYEGEVGANYRFYAVAIDNAGNVEAAPEQPDAQITVGGLGGIRGVKFEDTDGDGTRDDGEPGLPGWTVFLDQDGDGALDDNELRVVTGDDGSYAFANLPPGSYTVREVLRPGWMQTSPGASQAGQGIDSADIQVSVSGVEAAGPQGGQPVSAGWSLINLDQLRSDPRYAGITGTGVAVAVLDTGIDADHPFFGSDADGNGVADRIVYQYDFVNNDPVAEDLHGHGTHVAGILAASDATYGGIAPGVNLIVLRVLDANGRGSLASVERALQWVSAHAAEYNIAAVNMSFGDGGNYNQSSARYGLGDELAALSSQGVAVVAAAGNGYFQADSRLGAAYPAADPNALGIGAVWSADLGGPYAWGSGAVDNTTGADRVASFSQRHQSLTEVFAPGTLITGAGLGGGLATYSGTSMAAPQVTGLAALARQIAIDTIGRPLTPGEFRNLLQTTGVVIADGDDEDDNVVNSAAAFRRLDAWALAEAIASLPATPPPGSNAGAGAGAGTGTVRASGSHTVVVAAGQAVEGIDFGNFKLGTASGRVFNDADGDGLFDDGETALPGWGVYVDVNDNGRLDTGEANTQTDGSGSYTLGGLLPGTHRIRQVLPPEYVATSPGVGHDITVVASGHASAGLNFGVRPDTTPPDTPVELAISPDTGTSGADGLTNSGTVTLSGRLGESGLAVGVYDLATGAELGAASVSGTTFQKPTTLAEGVHRLRVRATDRAGNFADAFLDVTVDRTAPSVADVIDVTPDPRASGVAEVVVRFSERIDPSTLGAEDFALTLNGQPVVIPGGALTFEALDEATYRVRGWGALTAADGAYELTVRAQGVADAAGNAGSGSAADAWVVDTVAPSSRVDALPQVQTGKTFAVRVTGQDAGAGVREYDIYARVNGSPWQLWATVPAANPVATYTAASNQSIGFYSVARDAAGNAEPKEPVIEASTYLPDVDAPATQVTEVAAETATFTVRFTGQDVGGGALAAFDLYVSIDEAAAAHLGRFAAGTPNAQGVHAREATYQALSDGLPHSYRFFTVGVDSRGNAEAPPAAPADVTVARTFAPPAALAVAGFDVQRNMVQRSFVRYLDVTFNTSAGVAELVGSYGTSSSRVRLTRFGLDGGGGTGVDLTGAMLASGGSISFDFGAAGLVNGYYVLAFDLDGDGTFETERRFYRLLGDVNGDRRVDQSDVRAVQLAQNTLNPELDVDGSGGKVNVYDYRAVYLAAQAPLTRLLDALLIDD
jgi:subtilase family serine protease